MADVTILKPGQSLKVLDNADLAAGDPSSLFKLAPGYNGDGLATFIGGTGDVVLNLLVTPDNGITFFLVDFTDSTGTNIEFGAGTASAIQLSSAFVYAVTGQADITAGTIWVGR